MIISMSPAVGPDACWHAATSWSVDGAIYYFYLYDGLPLITEQGTGQRDEQLYEVQSGLYFMPAVTRTVCAGGYVPGRWQS